MGNIFSSCITSKQNGTRAPADFSDEPHSVVHTKANPNGESPPRYEETQRHNAEAGGVCWHDAFMNAVAECRSVLQSTRDFHHLIFVDDNYRMTSETQNAMKRLLCVLSIVLQATDAHAEMYFASHRNKDSAMPADKERMAKLLDELFFCKGWSEAEQLVQSSSDLQSLRIESKTVDKWMTDVEAQGNSADENFINLLPHIRQLKVPYWKGWNMRGLTCEELSSLYKNALEESRKQPLLLNSTAFTIRRAVQRAQRSFESHAALPTKIYVLTGSKLHESEVQTIKEELKGVRGGAEEFTIKTVPFVESLKDPSLKAHLALDKFLSSNKDIIDTVAITSSMLLGRAPNAGLLKELFDQHDKKVSEDGKYDTCDLRQGVNYPTRGELRKAMNLVDEE